jgi:hypothetical protein
MHAGDSNALERARPAPVTEKQLFAVRSPWL